MVAIIKQQLHIHMRSVGSVTGAYTHEHKLNWHANDYTGTGARWAA